MTLPEIRQKIVLKKQAIFLTIQENPRYYLDPKLKFKINQLKDNIADLERERDEKLNAC